MLFKKMLFSTGITLFYLEEKKKSVGAYRVCQDNFKRTKPTCVFVDRKYGYKMNATSFELKQTQR